MYLFFPTTPLRFFVFSLLLSLFVVVVKVFPETGTATNKAAGRP